MHCSLRHRTAGGAQVFGVFLIPVCIREEDRVFYQELETPLQLALFRRLGWIGGAPLGRPRLPLLKRLGPRTLAAAGVCDVATIAACRTSSVRTARRVRSTTTGARG